MFLKTNWVCLSKNTQIYTDKQSKDLNTFLPIKISAKKKARGLSELTESTFALS